MSIVLRPAPEVQADEISQNVVISACGLAFCHGIAGTNLDVNQMEVT